ncbi:unnamed protein product [Clavelina lepadiformis]|uniref:EGF-like domain-containing protein n=1 Tax=Clavelina lepadiformis TaxID=159417 RepID=A0ABP0F3K1_CLALP
MVFLFLVSFLLLDSSIVFGLTLINEHAVVRKEVTTYLKCVADQADMTHDAFKRVMDTGTGLKMPAMALVGPISPESWPGKRLSLFPEAGPERTGIFSCEAKDKNTNILTKAVAIKIGTAGGIWPKHFTYVANVGDENVNLTFSAFDKDLDIVWRFEGGIIAESSLSHRIRRVSRRDAGVYECYSAPSDSNRNSYRPAGGQAMLRLIVRNCPPNKWNWPDCSSDCSCINGGACDEVTGDCVCPPGFHGNNCDEGCGGNRFGSKCQFQCKAGGSTNGDDAEECKGRQFCLPDPYGCSCATGFSGLECLNGCPNGQFGANCEQTCHCKRPDLCNRFTGSCTMGCASGWKGPSCQTECQSGQWGENCENDCHCLDGEDCNSVNGKCPRGCEPPYTGNSCQVDAIDDCSSDPCLRGGRCVDAINEYKCECLNGTGGDRCETDHDDCQPNPCSNGGRCEDTGRLKFLCHCAAGFTGESCETDIDDCQNNKCQNDAECVDEVTTYHCECGEGYTGRYCETPLSASSSLNFIVVVAILLGAVVVIATTITVWYVWSRKNKTRLQHITVGKSAW